jgi:hypothetical protein
MISWVGSEKTKNYKQKAEGYKQRDCNVDEKFEIGEFGNENLHENELFY